MIFQKKMILTGVFLICILFVNAQSPNMARDTAGKPFITKNLKAVKDTGEEKYNPNKAVIRSAIIPGWGQITNKKYWKVPIVYGALGTTTYLFLRNLKQYKDAKYAYELATDNDTSNDHLIIQPYYTVKDQPERIRVFRNQVRQNVDYSVLFFIAFWGLNVADAAVDAHLKTFDVGNNLSFEIKPGYSPMANTKGISIVMNIGRNKSSYLTSAKIP
ncbi:MAG: hypothetical protein JSU03_12415 [Bacteroidetes bacterium]|nr:hypothetical protein [Bacteroidota bacterium]MBS1758069.1 hypothetical protein [Bacteroidota bacterium]